MTIYERQYYNTKVLLCRTDKSRCIISCPKCYENTSHSKLFKSPENLWRHLWQAHTLDKNEYPSIEEVIYVLEEISIALQNNISLTTIPGAVKWKMIIK